ncbi:MAG TPA: hypothetical protein VFI16_05410 [Anaeromyxobacteraceae bacterium]|nr:hypothetical protein [Anaeromyxobacteraceae bacterium]
MNRILSVTAAAAAALLFVACENPAKAPADAAIKAAEAAVADVKGEAQKFVPDQLKAVQDAIAAARAKFTAGEFPAALTGAQDAVKKAAELAAAIKAKKDELTAAWKTAAAQMGVQVQAINEKLAELAKAKKLPKGLDKDAVQKAKDGLAALTKDWSDAAARFGGGQLQEAVAAAKGLLSRAQEIAATLGAQPAGAAPAAK